jgi:hypothetical protein
MKNRTIRPAVDAVGERAADILERIEADADYPRLRKSALLYSDCWATFTGYPIVCGFDQDKDSPPLFVEALRVLALKAAVYELSDEDEHAAELVVSPPVDEMVHAVLAQYTLCVRLQQRTGITLVHMTDRERFGWRRGDYTEQCYRAARWGAPPVRYWVGADEVKRRLAILSDRYASIGVHEGGARVDVRFDAGRVLAG